MDGRDSMGLMIPPSPLCRLLLEPTLDVMLRSLIMDGRLSELRGPILGRDRPVKDPLRHSIST